MTANGIVCNGAGRWWAGVTETIRGEVIAACAKRFENTSRWERVLLRWEVEREISRRLKDVKPPPPESLF